MVPANGRIWIPRGGIRRSNAFGTSVSREEAHVARPLTARFHIPESVGDVGSLYAARPRQRYCRPSRTVLAAERQGVDPKFSLRACTGIPCEGFSDEEH